MSIAVPLYGFGSSGGGLRARVFDGTSAPPNPKENDIWIKTSVAINGCELSDKTLPIGWSMPKGFVYVKGDFGGAYEYRDTTGLHLTVPGTHAVTVYARLTSCIQYNGSAWESKDAWIWHGSQWHQFSGAFSARINVVYPAGSTCTISNGSETYTAPSTTGYWECYVYSAGTWTVTATNGPQSASQSVSITASGQTAGVTLTYDYKIFNAGGAADYSGGWTIPESYGSKVESDGIKLYTVSSWQGCQVFTSVPFDVTKYSKLNINVGAYNSARPEASFGVSSGKPNNNMWNGDFTNKKNCAAVQSITGTGVISLDISSLSGNYYFWIGQDGATWDGAGFTVVTVWLT